MALHRLSDDLRASARELKRVRSLAVAGMLMALQILLGILTIPISSSVQITFDYLPLCVAGMLLGPVPSMLTAALADVIAFLIRPTGAFNPGFSVSAALSGLIYGLFFYRRDAQLWRTLTARLLTVILCNVCLNTLWLILMYGPGAWAWIPGRILKNAVEYPVSIILLTALWRVLPRVRKAS